MRASRLLGVISVCGALAVSSCGGGSVSQTSQAPKSPASSSTTSSLPRNPATSSTATPTTTLPIVTTTTQPRSSTPAPSPPPPSSPPQTVVVPDASIGPVNVARLGASWHEGCPVPPAQLRLVTVPYVDFEGVTQTGELIVHADVADGVAAVFSRLAAERFPIRQMRTVEQFGASDDASLAADNTAAFNCRPAVTAGGPVGWSEHAYGRAIDVNPIENPYLPGDGRVMPPAGAPYADRGDVRPGMAGPGSAINRAFGDSGWAWGGTWSANPDYQHFSVSGR